MDKPSAAFDTKADYKRCCVLIAQAQLEEHKDLCREKLFCDDFYHVCGCQCGCKRVCKRRAELERKLKPRLRLFGLV